MEVKIIYKAGDNAIFTAVTELVEKADGMSTNMDLGYFLYSDLCSY